MFDTSRAEIDNHIVALILARDPQGPELLCRHYRSGLLFLAERCCGIADAEDCVQEALITATQQIQRGALKEPSALVGYLRVILRRAAADIVQELKRKQGDQLDMDIADQRSNPELALEELHKVELLQRGLHALKPFQQELLERFYLQNQSPNRICQAMDLTETQFRMGKWRAKQALQSAVARLLQRQSFAVTALAS